MHRLLVRKPEVYRACVVIGLFTRRPRHRPTGAVPIHANHWHDLHRLLISWHRALEVLCVRGLFTLGLQVPMNANHCHDVHHDSICGTRFSNSLAAVTRCRLSSVGAVAVVLAPSQAERKTPTWSSALIGLQLTPLPSPPCSMSLLSSWMFNDASSTFTCCAKDGGGGPSYIITFCP